MPFPKLSHYEVLGVPRGAKTTDIVRAYRRLKSEIDNEFAAPDPTRAARLKAAHDTLADEQQRAAYDARLDAPVRQFRAKGMKALLIGLAVLVSVAAASYWLDASVPKPLPGAKTADEIQKVASFSIGRLDRIDISGRSTPVGMAFATEEGVMVTVCDAIDPQAQHVVYLSPRNVSARVLTTDTALGLCKLAVDGAGSRPLEVSGVEPRTGDRIYATKINAAGEFTLIAGTVKKVTTDGRGRVIETSTPVAPAGDGAPLLDAYGRVVGVATSKSPNPRGHHIAITTAWTTHARPATRPAPASEAPAASEPKVVAPPGFPKGPHDSSPERREAIEKAFRPPPTVPNEL
jgi:S1-C subfamily serine protease